jgi:hypothetical protein
MIENKILYMSVGRVRKLLQFVTLKKSTYVLHHGRNRSRRSQSLCGSAKIMHLRFRVRNTALNSSLYGLRDTT